MKIYNYILFLENKKEKSLLLNSEKYIKNWESSLNSDFINDDDYLSIL